MKILLRKWQGLFEVDFDSSILVLGTPQIACPKWILSEKKNILQCYFVFQIQNLHKITFLPSKNCVKSGSNIARKFGRIQIQICHVHRHIATVRKSAWKSHTKISQKLTLPKMSLWNTPWMVPDRCIENKPL